MTKFVRYPFGDRVFYGIHEGKLVYEISGSPFDHFERTSRVVEIQELRLLPPVQPTKILCVGLNYRHHIREVGKEVPEFPSHFIKPLTAVIGPDESIIYPRIANRVDFEGELAIVIKDRIRDVTEEDALNHVLGCTCFNDVTERTWSKIPGQLTRAKGFDSFASFGPCIATGLDPMNLTVQTFVNGESVQEGRTSDMVFPVPFLIHFLSQCMTLLPGDIISTGTPSGIAPLQPDDVVEVSIEGIGTLRNRVVASE